MSAQDDDRPLVDEDTHASLTGYLKRVLEHATPDSWIAGGESRRRDRFKTRPRNRQELKHREEIYLNGGPITEFIDTRALMTYGTGVEFDLPESAASITEAQGRTVDEWLADQFGDRLDLLMIDAGIQTYWAGDAWVEIVETRGGDFSHLELVDPTTVDPDWDRHGELTELRQVIKGPRGKFHRQGMDEERIGHLTFRDSTGGPLGDSLVAQNRDEINRYVSNQEQRANAIKLHGSPKYDVSVGSEGQSIPDKIMRMIDRKFRPERIDEKTTWTHGGDIEIETLESPGMGDGMKTISETDIAMLAGSFGIPLEWTNFGSAGLGEGTPAESRILKFERQARAEQLRRINQFKHEIIRPILRRYSPFPEDIDVEIRFGDVVSDPSEVVGWLSQVDWAFHRDEIREMVGRQPWDDEDDREAPPELATDAGPAPGEGGGLFSDRDRGRDQSDQDVSTAATAPDGPAVADGGGAIGADAPPDEGNGRCPAGDGRALLYGDTDAEALTQEELVWQRVVEDALWSWGDAPERQLFGFDDEDLPEFVQEAMEQAVPDAIAESSLQTLDDDQIGFLGDALQDALEDDHGWSLDSIQRHIDEIPGVDLERWERERIGRDITQNAVGKAREAGYREREDFEALRFDWIGPDDRRTTEACEWIKGQIPEEGVPMDELKELIQAANDRFVEHSAREWSPHIQCRHQPVRTID